MHASFGSFGNFCVSRSRDILSEPSEVVRKVQSWYSDSVAQATQPDKMERGLELSAPDVPRRAFSHTTMLLAWVTRIK